MTQTLDLMTLRRVLYRCLTTAAPLSEDLRLPLGLVGLLVAGLLDLGELRHQHRVGIVRAVVDRHLGGRSASSKVDLKP